MKIFRLLRKNISLRTVNLLGLSIMFACLLLSAGYVKRELSYDRHHSNADRIVRVTLQSDGNPVDGRIYGNALDAVWQQLPEIERTVKMRNVPAAVLINKGEQHIVNDFYMVNSDFLHVFDLPLLQGDKNDALQRKGQALISESFARQLFGDLSFEAIQTSEITIESRWINETVFISGIFKDIPETSHFQSDILVYLPDGEEVYAYTYLLLKHQTDTKKLAQKITGLIAEKALFESSKTNAQLMPLADIHLNSHNLREMSVNGNIHYIYLVIGANVLLLIVVLFNLWLNASLIFSHNRRYYQILRLHGAPTSAVFKDEALMALLLGFISVTVGISAAYVISSSGQMPVQIPFFETVVLCPAFLLTVIAVSLLPALKGISTTLFINTATDWKPVRFSYSNVKWMLTAQYAVVMIVIILAFGINKQMNLVKDTQVGGNDRNMLVLTEQPEQVQAKYELLKTELLKHAEIEAVTSSFQLPGDAIRDGTRVRKEEDTDWQWLPIMIAGEDFLPFFGIRTIAGHGFSPQKYDYQTEETMLMDYLDSRKYSEHIEEYVINRKALATLGFDTPEEAVGEMLRIEHGTIDYFRRGIIVGVTDDFNYTGLFEETTPLLMMQRRWFQGNMMVRLAPDRFQQARAVFENVWNEVNPDYPADYLFMNDVFGRMYRNELNAQQLVYIFSLLCFLIADLGLIVFMAFIILRRTKEIGIRKVYGASVVDILRMLNMDFIRYMGPAFAIAAPVALFVMHRWLERFAYRTSLDWWIFALAAFVVLLVSVVSVSLQSWRAATRNPVETINRT
ncbi:MAG: ABC transporter permease [Tannerella sp.]|jgi:putative ABC transport system permease protein|nr:ABC transporter permease [Tannerella sp.]